MVNFIWKHRADTLFFMGIIGLAVGTYMFDPRPVAFAALCILGAFTCD